MNIPTLKCRNSRYADTIITAIPVTNLADAYWTTPSGGKSGWMNIAIDFYTSDVWQSLYSYLWYKWMYCNKSIDPYNLKKVNLTIQGDDILTLFIIHMSINMKVTVDTCSGY